MDKNLPESSKEKVYTCLDCGSEATVVRQCAVCGVYKCVKNCFNGITDQCKECDKKKQS